MRKSRYNYTPEEKVFILKLHLVDRIAVSDLCDEWQKKFLENGAAAFGRNERSRKRAEEARIQQLEDKLRRKHEVLS